MFLHSSLGDRPSGPVEAADAQLLDEPLTEFVTSRLESGAAAPADKAAANKKMVKVGLVVWGSRAEALTGSKLVA